MDPLSAAAAVAGILSAVKGMIDANAQQTWESSVSGKLDTIIQQNALILADLETLPLVFQAELISQFNNEVMIEANALNAAFDQYMAANPPDIEQIRSIRTRAEVLLDDLLQRGPTIYLSAGALMDLVIAIHKMLKVSPAETNKFIADCLEHMKIWGGQSDGMLGKATADLTTATATAEAALRQEPRGTVPVYSQQVEVVLPGGPHGGIHVRPVLKVLVDVAIDDGIPSVSVTNARSTFFDTTSFDGGVVAGHANEWRNKLQSEVDSIKHLRSLRNTAATNLAALNTIINSLT